ncbi:MAG: hypothetical protein ACRC33_17370 [Gemmataceae bacterium]
MKGAGLRLVVVTLVWGVSFPCTRAWQTAAERSGMDGLLAALTLIALRMALALAVLLAWQPRLLGATAAERRGGAAVGAAFLVGFILQTWALASTTPALSAFFTCVSSAWVPLVVLGLGGRVAPLTLLGLFLGLVGCAVLVEGWKLGKGEWLTLGASVLFAVQMILLDRFGKAVRAEMLSPAFLLVNGVGAAALAVLVAAAGVGVGPWLGWAGGMLSDPVLPWLVVLMAVFPTALGFHWMNAYQPRVSPSRAALIYLLEPVFSTAFSVGVRALTGSKDYDELTTPLILGGALILGGNLVVECFGASKGEGAAGGVPAVGPPPVADATGSP